MPTESESSEAALIIAIISLLVATVAAVATLMQLSWVKNLVCEQTSYFCDIDYNLKLFKIGYYPKDQKDKMDAWDVLYTGQGKLSQEYQRTHNLSFVDPFIDPTTSDLCITEDRFSSFLVNSHTADSDDKKEVNFSGDFVPSSWIFYTTPIQSNVPIKLTDNDDLIVYVDISYTKINRDVSVNLVVSVGDYYRYYEPYQLERKFNLPSGSQQSSFVCKLPHPQETYLRFKFDFEDDSYNKTTEEANVSVQ
jgi:hypothetical protein